MKFYLLPIGETFDYQGEQYIKSTPLVANNISSGKDRLIPRSADVSPQNGQIEPLHLQTDEKTVKLTEVTNAFEQFFQHCQQSIKALPADTAADVVENMEMARQAFIETLSSLPSSR